MYGGHAQSPLCRIKCGPSSCRCGAYISVTHPHISPTEPMKLHITPLSPYPIHAPPGPSSCMPGRIGGNSATKGDSATIATAIDS
eukprot:scaffold65670_cov19-Tisochrysis_lutea.AAC.1